MHLEVRFPSDYIASYPFVTDSRTSKQFSFNCEKMSFKLFTVNETNAQGILKIQINHQFNYNLRGLILFKEEKRNDDEFQIFCE